VKDAQKTLNAKVTVKYKQLSEAEIKEGAEYFSSIKPIEHWIRVVESATSPKVSYVGNLALPAKEKGVEPIAGRIIEMPEDEEQGDTLRNPRSGFVAYVPPGSVTTGEDLVTTGGMKIVGGKIAWRDEPGAAKRKKATR